MISTLLWQLWFNSANLILDPSDKEKKDEPRREKNHKRGISPIEWDRKSEDSADEDDDGDDSESERRRMLDCFSLRIIKVNHVARSWKCCWLHMFLSGCNLYNYYALFFFNIYLYINQMKGSAKMFRFLF